MMTTTDDTAAKGMLNQPTSNNPYSNQFPITGPPGERKETTEPTGVGMADIDTEDAHSDGVDVLVDIDTEEGPGMKDGGLIGSHSPDR